MTLTKEHIISSVSATAGLTRPEAIRAVESLLEQIKRTLESGENVLISGFGKFCVKSKDHRLGRNPATGEGMMLTGRRVVKFRCSPVLRQKIHGKSI